MEKVMLINGSPRAPKSNSKQFAQLFSENCRLETEYFEISKINHLEICRAMEHVSHILFVFPLYADGIPATLLNFLKSLETNPPGEKPVISVLVNCGFLEPSQNDTAVEMIRLFCRQNGYRFGSALEIGGGEALPATPFMRLTARKIKKLAECITAGKHRILHTTMPLPKRLFVKASVSYWVNYGKKSGISEEEMRTLRIEGK